MKNRLIVVLFMTIFLKGLSLLGQEPTNHIIFENQPINFKGEKGADKNASYLENGRIVYKKITIPELANGSDVRAILTLRSAGDRKNKAGSCFVVSDPNLLSIIDIAEKDKNFPENSIALDSFAGVKPSLDYAPVVELIRFITPFGIGHYSEQQNDHRKPVYITKWAKEVTWDIDVSHMQKLLQNTFYIGIWINCWNEEGYSVDLSLEYSNRPLALKQVKPLMNSIRYVKGQSLPDLFSKGDLKHSFALDKKVKNVKLYYIATGHGGHSGGDAFKKSPNRVTLDEKLVLDFIPWRDDCASYRSLNPTAGVWLKKDSASYIDFSAKTYKIKEIEERISSSDLSRSNWCPGSSVEPVVVDLGDMEAGEHQLQIGIEGATAKAKDKYNYWLVSAYLTYEE